MHIEHDHICITVLTTIGYDPLRASCLDLRQAEVLPEPFQEAVPRDHASRERVVLTTQGRKWSRNSEVRSEGKTPDIHKMIHVIQELTFHITIFVLSLRIRHACEIKVVHEFIDCWAPLVHFEWHP